MQTEGEFNLAQKRFFRSDEICLPLKVLHLDCDVLWTAAISDITTWFRPHVTHF